MSSSTEPQSQSQSTVPFSHTAAGHAGISTSADGNLLIKPCTPAEIAFYEAAKHHPNFQAHMPVYMGSLTLNDSPEEQAAAIALMNAQTQRDSTGAESATEASDAGATAAAVTNDDTANINPDTKPDTVATATTTGHITADLLINPAPTNKWTPSGGAKLTSNVSIVLSNATAGFVRPNIIDLKLGARLWDDDAPTAKRAKLDEVSQNSTSSSLGFRVAGMKVWVGDEVGDGDGSGSEVEEESEKKIIGEDASEEKNVAEDESENKEHEEEDESEKKTTLEEDPAPAPAPATVVQELSLGHILKGSPFHEQEHQIPVSVPVPASAPAIQEITLGHILKGSPFEEYLSTPITTDEVTTEAKEDITEEVKDEATTETKNEAITEVDHTPAELNKELDDEVTEETNPPVEPNDQVPDNPTTNSKVPREANTTITAGYKTYDKFYGRSNMAADGSNITTAFTSFLHSLTLLPTPKASLTSPTSPTSSYHSTSIDLSTARVAARRKLILQRILREIESIQFVLENEESRMYSASILIVYEGDPDALDSVLVYSSPGIISYDDVDVVTAYVRPGVDPVFTDGEDEDDEEDEDGEIEEEDDDMDMDAPDIDEEDEDDDDETKQKIHEVVMIDFAHAKFVPGEGPDENALKGVRSIRRILQGLLKTP